MQLNDLIEKFGGQAQFAQACGLDRYQLNRVVNERRKMGAAMAVKIFNATGHRLGPMAEDRAAA
jgi:plasmid maintenance system antidote protein VapI